MTQIKRIMKRGDKETDNGVHELYVNLEYPAENEDVKALLNYIKDTNCSDVDSCMGFENLVKRVQYLKTDTEGVKFMCEWSQWEREGGRAEGRAEGVSCSILDILQECGEIPDSLRQLIKEEDDFEMLRKWLKIAIKVKTVQEFEDKIALVI